MIKPVSFIFDTGSPTMLSQRFATELGPKSSVPTLGWTQTAVSHYGRRDG